MTRVFISYSRAHSAHAIALDEWLTGQGIATFLDTRALRGGQLWMADLEHAIEQDCDAVAVLCGPGGLGNTQQYEVQFALTRRARDRDFPVIPVVLPDTRDWHLPRGFLSLQTWVSFATTTDVRQDPAGLQRLLAAVRREALDADAVRNAICPYKGLDAFGEEDAELFFGRDKEAEELLTTVREHNIAAVIGRSGTGKSSLARAGLLPRLRRRGQSGWDTVWDIRIVRPGTAPLRALGEVLDPPPERMGGTEAFNHRRDVEQRLRDGGADYLAELLADDLQRGILHCDRALLMVDQAEELFAHPTSLRDAEAIKRFDADADRFIALLMTAAKRGPASVVMTIRSDYFAPLQDSSFGAVLKNAMVQVGRVQALRSCVEGPAGVVGLRFSPGLVDRVLADVGSDETNLPLLQHALARTWQAREGTLMTADAYLKAGGVTDAINKIAEDSYQSLTNAGKEAAQRLFLRLVRPGEGGAHVRQRAPLPQDADERQVAYRFAQPDRRLLFLGEEHGVPVVEVAHEALIRGWPTLVEWVRAAEKTLQTRADLLAWIEPFRRDDKPPDLIPDGALLARARELVAKPGVVPIDDIKDFIQRSADAVEHEAAEDVRRARRQARIFRALAAASLVAATIAGWFWWDAGKQRDQAQWTLIAAEGTARSLIDGLRRGRDEQGVPLEAVRDILRGADAGLGGLDDKGSGSATGIAKLRATGLFELGQTHWYRYEHEAARTVLTEALAIRARLAEPAADPELLRDAADTRERLAVVLDAMGKADEARATLRQVVANRQTVADREPGRTDAQRELLSSISRLVDLLQAGGPTSESQAELRQLAGRAQALGGALGGSDRQRALVLARRAGLAEPAESGFPAVVGEVFQDCVDCPQMVVIPSGTFQMGSTDGNDDERNGGTRTLNAPLAVGRYTVTFAEYDACVAAGGCNYRSGDWNWGRGQRPVILVNWYDAQAYAAWLGKRTGQPYRLLTEAEWEYAARGGTATRWFWGDQASDLQCQYANGADKSALSEPELAPDRDNPANFAKCDDHFPHSAPVGSFQPNKFGLYDMVGNVWQWVEDCYGPYKDPNQDASVAVEQPKCNQRVLRGGSWRVNPRNLRSANRNRNAPGYRLNTVGFRVARTPGR